MNFRTGKIAATDRIYEMAENNEQFAEDAVVALKKYLSSDFSGMEQEDIDRNIKAITNGEDRIFAIYDTCEGKINIMTNKDRSITTILFASEY